MSAQLGSNRLTCLGATATFIFLVLLFPTQLLATVCTEAQNCGECLRADRSCSWCSDVSFFKRITSASGRNQLDSTQCDTAENLIAGGCDSGKVVSEANSVDVLVSETQRDPDPNTNKPGIFLKPQRIKLKMRPNSPATIPINYRSPLNYPIDIYYLMDLSWSMCKSKRNVATLGTSLAQEMRVITNNLRVGFGSFVDKLTLPFTDAYKAMKMAGDQAYCTASPEPSENCSCAAPYGFKNALNLTEDVTKFAQRVIEAPVSANLDQPENSLDALVQAMVCKEHIGWRDYARKIVVLSSDARYHYAGDGKLAGIIKPNDGLCHLSAEGLYTFSEEQDYPSINLVRKIVHEKQVSLIFAVASKALYEYKEITKTIQGSAVGILSEDSSNVVNLVVKKYYEIAEKVELQVQKKPEEVEVKMQSKCRGQNVRETSFCDGVKLGENVTFDVTFTLTKCPQNAAERDASREIILRPFGIDHEVRIELEFACECDCAREAPAKPVPSPLCSNGSGSLVCGSCSCVKGRFGRTCQCETGGLAVQVLRQRCISPLDNETGILCSGRGECICDECACNSIPSDYAKFYSGTYCECDNYACPYVGGQLCAGQGRCSCGQCICAKDYGGRDCNCYEPLDRCYATTDKLCNDQGACECGRCICKPPYRGPTCEKCPTCPTLCAKYKNCARCAFREGKYFKDETCAQNCVQINIVDSVPRTLPEESGSTACSYVDEEGCKAFFVYRYDKNFTDYVIDVERKKECPYYVNPYLAAGIVVGAVILLGFLALIIWKCVVTYQDRKECERFNREVEKSLLEATGNPLYKEVVTEYTVPPEARQNLNSPTSAL